MGGGGGDNGMMMMMMMSQQAAAQERQAAADRLSQEQKAQQAIDDRAYKDKQTQQEHEWATAQQAQARQQTVDDRTYADTRTDTAQKKIEDAKAAADLETKNKLSAWQGTRDATYGGTKNDAMARLQAMGITDPSVQAAVMSGLGTANSAIPELATNVGSYFDGVVDRVLGQQTEAARTKYGQQLNQYLPQGFETSRVEDTTDDAILEGILGEQYNEASATAKRLFDRGVITQEGYDANLSNLGKQKNAARAKLTTMGDNELAAERTRLGNIANTGRAAASNYTLGSTFDPQSYSNQVSSAYDKWFAGLGDTLKGVAPTDLFDTSGFNNTAGAVQGPRNSPFVGSTNALTGVDASTQSEEEKKKKNTSTGVF